MGAKFYRLLSNNRFYFATIELDGGPVIDIDLDPRAYEAEYIHLISGYHMAAAALLHANNLRFTTKKFIINIMVTVKISLWQPLGQVRLILQRLSAVQ